MAEKKDGQGSTYSVIQDLGDLSKPTKKGEQKRVSICDYKGELRLDIRRWGTGGTMLNGISLDEDEVRRLRYILDNIDFGNL